MEQTEFIGQIEKHEARIKKYTSISGVVGLAKLLFALALGLFIILSFYYMFSGNLRAKMVLWCLIAGASLVAIWIYHDKIRDKIKHSRDMISINKKHLDKISDLETASEVALPCLTGEEYTRQQTVVTGINRDTGFSNYYESRITKDPAVFKTAPPKEPADEEVFAKATAIKFLMM